MTSKVILKDHLETGDEYARLQMLHIAHLRPQISEPTPQKTAPIKRPIFCWSGDRERQKNPDNVKSGNQVTGEKVATCLTEFEERPFEGKLVHDGGQNQASDDLRRVSFVRGWVSRVCLQATGCPLAIRNRRQRRATTVGDGLAIFWVDRAEGAPDTSPCQSPGERCSGALPWHGTHGQDQERRLRSRYRWWPHKPGQRSRTSSRLREA